METLVLISGILAFATASLAAITGLHSHHRDAAIWLSCAAVIFTTVTVFAGFQASEWKRDAEAIKAASEKPKFAIELLFAEQRPNREPILKIILHGPNVICPISTIIFVQLTNDSDNALMINSLTLLATDNAGKWNTVNAVNIAFGQIVDPMADAMRYSFDPNDFLKKLQDRTIAPGEVIRGWILVDTRIETFKWRAAIGVANSSKVELIEIIPKYSGPGLGNATQFQMFEAMPPKVNTRGLKEGNYGDYFKAQME